MTRAQEVSLAAVAVERHAPSPMECTNKDEEDDIGQKHQPHPQRHDGLGAERARVHHGVAFLRLCCKWGCCWFVRCLTRAPKADLVV